MASYAIDNTKGNIDKVVAVVNNEPIFISEVNTIVNSLISRSPTTLVKQNELKNIILNQQIEALLLKQEAKKQKIQVTKQEIQLGINEIKKLFKNEQDFNNELKKLNMTITNLTRNVTEQISIIKLLSKSLSSKIKIPNETEIKSFYDKFFINFKPVNKENNTDIITFVNLLRKKFSEHVKIQQIFIKCPKNASATQIQAAQTKIANIKGALQKQKSFTSIASHYSSNFGLIYKNDLANNINNVIFNLKVGEYTKEPIKTDNGYHFIKIEEKYARRDLNYNDVKNDIKEFLYRKSFMREYISYIKSLKSKSYIKINQNW
jgi:parvulin-like peptidyl-prolyl isomerase